jgi:hypothetical protein
MGRHGRWACPLTICFITQTAARPRANDYFYRFHFSRRPRRLTRIGEVLLRSKLAGRPVDVRAIRFEFWQKIEFPPSAAGCKRNFGLRGRPQPSKDTPACPTCLGEISRGGRDQHTSRRGRTSGRVFGRLTSASSVEPRSSPSSKLLYNFPPQAVTLFFLNLRRLVRTSPGQPTGYERKRNSPIRASRRSRGEHCNR